MSAKNDYAKVISKLTSFRSHTSELFESEMGLVRKILDSVQPLYDRKLENLTEKESGRLELYLEIVTELKQCLEASKGFNDSLTKDYAEALNLLSRMQGGSDNG